MNANMKMKAFGRYKIVITNDKDKTTIDHGWRDNVVLNKVLKVHNDNLYPKTFNMWLGSGATTPTASDVGLENPIAKISGSYYMRANRMEVSIDRALGIMRFTTEQAFNGGTGAVIGNISELGVGIVNSSSYKADYIFTRALVKDELGNPATITLGEFDRLTVYYNHGWEFDLKQELLNTTFDYKGVSTKVVAKFIDWDMSPKPNYYTWENHVTEPNSDSYAYSDYCMLPSDSTSKGLSVGRYLHLIGSTSPIPAIDTADTRAFSNANQRLTGRGNVQIDSSALASGVFTLAMRDPLVINAGTGTGYISAITTSESGDDSKRYYGGRIAYMFDPPLEKLASDTITIQSLSTTFTVA